MRKKRRGESQMSELQEPFEPIATPAKNAREQIARYSPVHLCVLLVTCSPSEGWEQARLRALSAHLRMMGHRIVVCVPPGSLGPSHAADADGAGIEYVFIQHRPGIFAS